MRGPCIGCPDRYPGCHDRCERYAEWVRPLRERYAERAALSRMRESGGARDRRIRLFLNRKKAGH